MMELIPILSTTLAVTLAAVVALWVVSILVNDVSIIDLGFPSLMALNGVVAFLLVDQAGTRAMLLFGLTLIWAARLSWYLFGRNLGNGEDVRYTKLRENAGGGWSWWLPCQ